MACALLAVPAMAQTTGYPSTGYPSTGYPAPGYPAPGYPGSPVDVPQTNMTPIAPPPANLSAPTGGYGSFDPYATSQSPVYGGGAGAIPGVTAPMGPGVTTIGPPAMTAPPVSPNVIPPSPPGSSLFSRVFGQPTAAPMAPVSGIPAQGPMLTGPALPPMYSGQTQGGFTVEPAPVYGQGPVYAPAGPTDGYIPPPTLGPQPGYAPPTYPSSIYPSSTPSVLFPQGLGGVYQGGLFTNPGETYSAFRLLQGPRFRYTYVSPGKKPYHLGINDFDTSVVFAFPNFLYSTQPIFVIPSFSLHLWSGPDGATGSDLPSKAYSGFLDFGWETDPNMMWGTELGVRFGAFTDFDTWNSDSFRVLGKAFLSFRLTPTSTIKGGIYYLDRNSIKLVPAGGFICRPNPFTRLDLFFPQPKFARRCRTIGTRDVWWYLAGDFGGGSWTIGRDDGTSDSVDLNDLRAIFGIEFGTSEAFQINRRSGFAEIGYVFKREVKYRYNPEDNYKPDDGFMFRIGIGY